MDSRRPNAVGQRPLPRLPGSAPPAIAGAANELLDGLSGDSAALVAGAGGAPVEDGPDAEMASLSDWCAELGLARPDISGEIVDDDTGEALVYPDAAWPEGMQQGPGEQVALLLERDEESEARLGQMSYRFFTSTAALRHYVEELLNVDLDGDGVIGPVELRAKQPTLRLTGRPPSRQSGRSAGAFVQLSTLDARHGRFAAADLYRDVSFPAWTTRTVVGAICQNVQLQTAAGLHHRLHTVASRPIETRCLPLGFGRSVVEVRGCGELRPSPEEEDLMHPADSPLVAVRNRCCQVSSGTGNVGHVSALPLYSTLSSSKWPQPCGMPVCLPLTSLVGLCPHWDAMLADFNWFQLGLGAGAAAVHPHPAMVSATATASTVKIRFRSIDECYPLHLSLIHISEPTRPY